MSFRNQGTQVRDNIDRTAKNAINTTNLANGLSVWCLNGWIIAVSIYPKEKLKKNKKKEKKNVYSLNYYVAFLFSPHI